MQLPSLYLNLLLAQAVPPDAPFYAFVALVVPVLAMGVVAFWRWSQAEKSAEQRAANEARVRAIFRTADLVFGVVEELARLTPTDIDNKALYALRLFREKLEEQGLPPPTPAEERVATAVFKARHAALHEERRIAEVLSGAPDVGPRAVPS